MSAARDSAAVLSNVLDGGEREVLVIFSAVLTSFQSEALAITAASTPRRDAVYQDALHGASNAPYIPVCLIYENRPVH